MIILHGEVSSGPSGWCLASEDRAQILLPQDYKLWNVDSARKSGSFRDTLILQKEKNKAQRGCPMWHSHCVVTELRPKPRSSSPARAFCLLNLSISPHVAYSLVPNDARPSRQLLLQQDRGADSRGVERPVLGLIPTPQNLETFVHL